MKSKRAGTTGYRVVKHWQGPVLDTLAYRQRDMLTECIDYVRNRVEEDEDVRAQHGPVKVLVKDGKPV